MTTIAVRDGIMAADSMVSDSGIYAGRVQKLFRISCGIMSGVGQAREILTLRDWLNECGPDGKSPPEQINKSEISVLLLCDDGRLFCFEGVSRFEIDVPFQAIGSGMGIALGAMSAGASAERAVEIACGLDVYSRGPVVTETAT